MDGRMNERMELDHLGSYSCLEKPIINGKMQYKTTKQYDEWMDGWMDGYMGQIVNGRMDG